MLALGMAKMAVISDDKSPPRLSFYQIGQL